MSKKVSCKKRKLKYIRSKNNLRNGGSLFWSFKSSNDFYTDPSVSSIVISEIERFQVNMSKKYKMNIGAQVLVAMCGNDRIHDKVTVQIECKHIKGESFIKINEF